MTKESIADIIGNFPENSIAHMKTINGDKYCIKDNGGGNKISIQMAADYLRVGSRNVIGDKQSLNEICIGYDSIISVESTSKTIVIEDY